MVSHPEELMNIFMITADPNGSIYVRCDSVLFVGMVADTFRRTAHGGGWDLSFISNYDNAKLICEKHHDGGYQLASDLMNLGCWIQNNCRTIVVVDFTPNFKAEANKRAKEEKQNLIF